MQADADWRNATCLLCQAPSPRSMPGHRGLHRAVAPRRSAICRGRLAIVRMPRSRRYGGRYARETRRKCSWPAALAQIDRIVKEAAVKHYGVAIGHSGDVIGDDARPFHLALRRIGL